MIDNDQKDDTQEPFPPVSSDESVGKAVSGSMENMGSQIGPYKLMGILGEGGYGIVYLAEQKKPFKRQAALKIIKPGMDSKQVIARFEAERQALALLDHPNIAHVFDSGMTDNNRPYFAMEYVKGISITKYCDQQKLNIEDRLQLFLQVCEAVQHAHQKGIIHRDIKPSNILVTRQGEKAIPKIIDFGVAKAVTQPLTERTLFTEKGQLLGTPEYMSPEQADIGNQDIDTRSDIYSLGVLLYVLLTGALPFDRRELEKAGFVEIQRIIREEDPPHPSTRLSSLGKKATEVAQNRRTQVVTLTKRLHNELEWIPLKAMRKERARRYQSASELASDIQNYLNGIPLSAGPPSMIYQIRKFVHRNKALVSSIAAVLLILIVGIIISTNFAIGQARARDEVERQARISQAVANFLNEDLLAAVGPSTVEGREVTVKEVLESASKKVRLEFKGEPLIQAVLHRTLGVIHMKVGENEEAKPHLERALDLRLTYIGEDDLSTLESMSDLGLVYLELGRYCEAEPLFNKALKIARRVFGNGHPQTTRLAENVRTLARAYHSRGKAARHHGGWYGETIADYSAAVRLDPDYAQALADLAWLRAACPIIELRDIAEAPKQAIAACELTGWKDHKYVATLAAVHAQIGDHTEAVSWQKKAIDLQPQDSRLVERANYEYRLRLFQSGESYNGGNIWSFTTGKMVARWEFEHAEDGKVLDSSGNNLHGTLSGDARIVVDPERGNVLSLDGDNDYVDCGYHPDFDITDEITIAAWIKVNKFDRAWQVIIAKGDTAWNLQRNWKRNDMEFGCRIISPTGEPSGSFRGSLSVNDGKWHHVAGVYDGSKSFLYIDGVLDMSRGGLQQGRINTNYAPLLIGAKSYIGGSLIEFWNGFIDDIRIYSYALSHAEIAELYLGRKLTKGNHLEHVIECHVVSSKKHPVNEYKNLERLSSLGIEQYKLGKYEKAVLAFRSADEIRQTTSDESPPCGVAFLALSLHQLGYYQKAIAALNRLRCLFRKGEYDDEESYLYEVEKHFAEQDSKIYSAWSCIENGDLEQSVQLLEEMKSLATHEDPNRIAHLESIAHALARSYYRRARTAKHRGCSYADAIADYECAINLDPCYARAFVDLAWLRAACPVAELQDSTKAVNNATKACEITNWKDHRYVGTLAAIHAELSDFDTAVKWQKKAIDLIPKNERLRWQTNYKGRLKLFQTGKPYQRGSIWAFSTGQMVAWWKFDEVKDSNTVVDSSGNSLHGNLKGDAKIVADAERGMVLSLDDDSDYVDCGYHPLFDIADEITIAAWVKVTLFDKRWQQIIRKGPWSWRLQRHRESNSVEFACTGLEVQGEGGNSSSLFGSLNINDGKWHHLVGVYDRTRLRLYVDGILDGSAEASGKIQTNTNAVTIGGPESNWDGLIDDVCILNYALNEDEIKTLYEGHNPCQTDD